MHESCSWVELLVVNDILTNVLGNTWWEEVLNAESKTWIIPAVLSIVIVIVHEKSLCVCISCIECPPWSGSTIKLSKDISIVVSGCLTEWNVSLSKPDVVLTSNIESELSSLSGFNEFCPPNGLSEWGDIQNIKSWHEFEIINAVSSVSCWVTSEIEIQFKVSDKVNCESILFIVISVGNVEGWGIEGTLTSRVDGVVHETNIISSHHGCPASHVYIPCHGVPVSSSWGSHSKDWWSDNFFHHLVIEIF